MTGNATISEGAEKRTVYEELLPQITHLVADEEDCIANLANIAAALKEAMGFLWVGFYFARDNVLVLGPFQGPVACTRIRYGQGVCGTAWKEKVPVRVDDVETFPGHIACSSLSRSEIVVPVYKNGEVVMVLDIDSDHLAAFDGLDEKYLIEVARIIEHTVL